MKITAEDVLRLLVRSATQFLTMAWKLLGENKKIIDSKD
jgi:hypothetical protein